jgi:hypothetical protein
MFWLSDAYNNAVNVTNPRWSRTAYSVEQHLNFEINLYPAHFCVQREGRNVKGLSEIRFSWIIFFLRLAGIPFKMKKMSTLYCIYMITVIMCTYSTLIGMSVDVYVHRDDLSRVMKNIRLLTGMTGLVWIYFTCR